MLWGRKNKVRESVANAVAFRIVFEGDELGSVLEMPRICHAVAMARGRSFTLPVDSLECPVARYVLRGETADREEAERRLSREFTLEVAERIVGSMPHLGGNIVGLRLSPLEKAKFEPDGVVYIVNPKRAMEIARSISAVGFVVSRTNGVAGACGEFIAAPVREKAAILSLGCGGSRRVLRDDELFLSVPYETVRSFLGGDVNV